MNSINGWRGSTWVFIAVALGAPAVFGQSIMQPNGGEILETGSIYTIRWMLDEDHEQHDWDLWYSISGPAGPWSEIAMDLPVGDPSPGSVHEFDWTVPATVSSRVRIRIRQDNVEDFQDVYGVSADGLRIRHEPPTGDIDDDGDTDIDDFILWAPCVGGPGVTEPPAECDPDRFAASDLDEDGDVDTADFAVLGAALTEPPAETARYRLEFLATWSVEDHPIDFPGNSHFSGLIGGTHNDLVRFWDEGELASPGIQSVAESGSKTLLQAEVEQEIDMGNAGVVLSGGGIRPSPGLREMTFTISRTFPLATIVSMIAPSPDWFVGVSGFPLFQDNRWIEEITVFLPPYDAGTDSGVTYGSPNQDTDPPEPIYEIFGLPFSSDGTVPPIGYFTFTRIE